MQWFNKKYKPKFFAKCFTQKQNVNFFDTLALVVQISSIQELITLASIHKHFIHQMNVKIAFLNDNLEEKNYMEQPKGCVVSILEKLSM